MFKVNNRYTRTTSVSTYFKPFSTVSVVDFEQVIVGLTFLMLDFTQLNIFFHDQVNNLILEVDLLWSDFVYVIKFTLKYLLFFLEIQGGWTDNLFSPFDIRTSLLIFVNVLSIFCMFDIESFLGFFLCRVQFCLFVCLFVCLCFVLFLFVFQFCFCFLVLFYCFFREEGGYGQSGCIAKIDKIVLCKIVLYVLCSFFFRNQHVRQQNPVPSSMFCVG